MRATYLETKRLILRSHIPTDFEDYFAYIMDRELQNMLGLRGVDDRASAQETFQWLLENGEFIALIGRDSDRVIGHICVQPLRSLLPSRNGSGGRA